MYVLRKIQGDLNKVACNVQCHWNGEHYVDIPKDILTRDEGILALYRDEVLTCLEETLKRFMDFI